MALPKIYRQTFNITGAYTVAPAVGGRTYQVVGLICQNNETVAVNCGTLRITGQAIDLYGGSSGAIKLSGRGDKAFFPLRPQNPHFITGAGDGLFLFSQVSSRRMSGIIYFTYTDA